MNPCKHLDYDGDYTNCELVEERRAGLCQNGEPVRYWRRGEVWLDRDEHGVAQNPQNVQFCRLRGRINGIFQCYNPGEMSCYEVAP